MEIRVKDVDLQISDNGTLNLGGYINVTNRESEVLFSHRKRKYFKEVMCSGVFKRAIEKANEIPLLFEHNWDKKLASTDDKSLELYEDNIGLRFAAKIQNEEVYNLVKEGAINACSFGFRALNEKIEPINAKLEKRYVDSIELLEVSLVKNPAYIGSLCETRSATQEQLEGLDLEDLEERTEKLEEDEKEEDKDKNSEKEIPKENDEKSNEENQDKKTETDDNKEDEKSKPVNSDEVENDKQEDEEEKEEEATVSRNFEPVITPQPLTTNAVSKEEVIEIVDELITQKLNEINKAELDNQFVQEELNQVQEIHKEIEAEIQEECMRNNLEVVRLRLELLKLNNLKKGIIE